MKTILAGLVALGALTVIVPSADARPHIPRGCWWSHHHVVCPRHHDRHDRHDHHDDHHDDHHPHH